MPAAAMDALGAFSHLTENLPTWINRMSDLATHTAAKHAEYAEAYKKLAVTPGRPRRRKNSSVCSIRTDELRNAVTQSPPPVETPTQKDPETPQPASQDPETPNPNPRKRGTDEAPSVASEENPFVSTRYNLVIHYDGETQKSLEEMVRIIGTARNNIRRGKMSQMGAMRSSALNKPTRINSPPLPPPGDAADAQLLSQIRSTRNRAPPPQARVMAKNSPFDMADRQLELAHSMCETAAYQFLRTGDCSEELQGVLDKFKALLELATGEVRRLTEEQERERAAKEKEAPQVESIQLTVGPTSNKGPSSDNGAIEVDDGTESEESIDLSAFRARRMMMRA
ncbi:hypothetical protein BDV24DRAFT_103328 [Aspergillus arachidicola]|uniref:Uncharacterized protein n=1 Tax=Aspergillus arachidicola TaxID=656916 RepID=A0A2G7G0Z7_9EURO|nr:hypothetical protein BDV24DRAFT_103328 [Aspergillus arachidicola]PIG86526.1 hypothetical protein AARAC_002116 [Aspergillus arachidicola]